jgi:hypothetical protein
MPSRNACPRCKSVDTRVSGPWKLEGSDRPPYDKGTCLACANTWTRPHQEARESVAASTELIRPRGRDAI